MAGGFALAGALGSGLLSAQSLALWGPSRLTFETHEQLAFVTAACLAVLLLWRISRHGAVPPDAPLAYLLLYALLVIVLLATGWFGGELVYGHSVGVGGSPP